MLLIQAVANTLLLCLFVAGGMLFMNKMLQRVMEQSFARVAAAEAESLDEQLRKMQDGNDYY